MTRKLITLLAAATVLLGVGTWCLVRNDETITVTADFPSTIGLYPGDDVRIVGVPVGKVTEINPEGDHVEVVMRLEAHSPAAADTGAVIVPPGLLASRYVQLTKPWLSGPRLADGTHLDESRTAAPMELDDVTDELDKFLAALGPQGANRDGAISELVSTADAALDGNGTTLRQTLADLADALDTIGDSRGDIVGTISQLQTFVTALSGSDRAIRSFENNLASVTTDLSHQHDQLAATIHGLAATTRAVQKFVRRNGSVLTGDVQSLARITTTLHDRQRELMEILDLVPVGLEAIYGTANVDTATLDVRMDLSAMLAHPDTTLCQILQTAGLPQLCSTSIPGETGGAS